VVNSKWHSKRKVSVQARLRLSLTSEEADFAKREAIFSSLRSDICAEFRLMDNDALTRNIMIVS
jgi:hypothetical protein